MCGEVFFFLFLRNVESRKEGCIDVLGLHRLQGNHPGTQSLCAAPRSPSPAGFNIFTVQRFENSVCASSDGPSLPSGKTPEGICTLPVTCTGRTAGSCAGGLGACCVGELLFATRHCILHSLVDGDAKQVSRYVKVTDDITR